MNDAMRVAPKQVRAKDRVETILAAARMHYANVGRDRFSLNGVAELTDPACSKGTVYRYFPDRVALLDAILPDRDASEGILARIDALVDAQGLQDAQKWAEAEKILRG